MDYLISKQDKIDIVNQHLDGINVNMTWLTNNIGIVEEIPFPGKLTMQEQLENLVNKKNALLEVLKELDNMI